MLWFLHTLVDMLLVRTNYITGRSIMPTNESLVKLIQLGTDVHHNMETLWNQNLAFIQKVAAAHARNQHDIEDLTQEGYFALVTAAERYDPECGAKFTTYLFIHLNGQMRRYYARNKGAAHYSDNIIEYVTKYRRIKEVLEKDNGANDYDIIIQKLLNVSQKKLDAIKAADLNINAASLDASDTETSLNLYDRIPDTCDPIADLIDRHAEETVAREVRAAVSRLDQVEQEVITKSFWQQKTGVEIAEELNLKEHKVHTVRNNALKKLASGKQGRRLRMMAADVYGLGIHGVSLNTFRRTWTSSTERAALIRYEETTERHSIQDENISI